MLDSRLVGTWSFVDAVRVQANGERQPTYASGGTGLMIYGEDGHYVAVLTGAGREPLTTHADSSAAALAARQTASVERRAALFATMNAEWGTWDFDAEHGERVTHRLGSMLPEVVGTEERRYVAFSGDVLTYSSSVDADDTHLEVTFRRVTR